MDVKGCLLGLLGIFAFYSIASAIAGILVLLDGDFYTSNLHLFYPLGALIVIIIAGRIYDKFVSVPRKKLKDALHKMHNYPKRIVQEDGGQWGQSFQRVIGVAFENATEEDKKNDLQQCGRIVEKMTNEKSFSDLHHAFRLTGCHLKITDENGELITKVV